ncbi:MAG: ABC transporter permease [Planctomycetes bacterium]|jgi:ABC-type transport system involved in multi-copper enzyme maturation permease subunit|nr:ABC transporter permease [Planctomycetota bacterium]
MNTRDQIVAMGRIELAEVLRSRWLWFCVGTYLALSGVFVLVGLRESSVLGFTGMGRVLMSFSHALVLLLPLLGLSASGQVINRMRDEGSLELWFSHPVTRGSFFVAVSLVRFAVLVAPLVVILPLLGLIGQLAFGQAVPWGFVLRTVLVSAALLAVAVALGLLVSTFVRNQSKALMLLLLIWALGVALLDFALVGLMLQGHVQPLLVFVLAALNPVQDARLALISGADAELGQLGPVGFFLAQRLGPAGLLAIGIAWPLTLAASAWLVTLQRFRRADLV